MLPNTQIDPDDIEVDIDAIDPSTFWAADKFVKECVQPGSQNLASKGTKKRAREEAGAAAAPKRA